MERQAFPRTEDCINHKNKDFDLDGMTLREWYSGMAMLGILSDKERVEPIDFVGSIDKSNAQIIAENSFYMADAMIAESERRGDAPQT